MSRGEALVLGLVVVGFVFAWIQFPELVKGFGGGEQAKSPCFGPNCGRASPPGPRKAAPPIDREKMLREREQRLESNHALKLTGRHCLGYGWVADVAADGPNLIGVKAYRIDEWRYIERPTPAGERARLPLQRRTIGERQTANLHTGRYDDSAMQFWDGNELLEVQVAAFGQRWFRRGDRADLVLLIGGDPDLLIEYNLGRSGELRLRDRLLTAEGKLWDVPIGIACEPGTADFQSASSENGGQVTER